MIKIRKFENREVALENILYLDKEYNIIKHNFKQGETVEIHKHSVDEWVIFNYGECEITLNSKKRIFKTKEKALAVYLPKNEEHGLRCLTDISYWVLRKK